jgi:hypothetical protein
MDVGQSVAGCAVRGTRRLGCFFEGTSQNSVMVKFAFWGFSEVHMQDPG